MSNKTKRKIINYIYRSLAGTNISIERDEYRKYYDVSKFSLYLEYHNKKEMINMVLERVSKISVKEIDDWHFIASFKYHSATTPYTCSIVISDIDHERINLSIY